MGNELIPVEVIQNKILIMREQKVMIDRDLAELYGVETKVLNQAVKRNKKRFPKDFMFQLNNDEINEVVTNCDHLEILKYSPVKPYVFTEQGVAMLSSVLNSDRAIFINIQIMRAFVEMRKLIATNEEILRRLEQIEDKLEGHDSEFGYIYGAIKQIIEEPEKSRKQIGFRVEEE